ncbi:hypothetical protein KM043_010559 [Ampulex compressa]|nr:hypothetical protein KM043_010559 [Ampulex compressa]
MSASASNTNWTSQIIGLVKLLRQNGDKVLNASSKLSLSTEMLHNLNEAFALIVDKPEDMDSSFRVCNSSEIDIFRDLKFLHDFVQKTVGLKIVHCSIDPNMPVDITKFRHLKYLELRKVCIYMVKGLQGIRGQLESVTCTGRKGVGAMNQLLVNCGGDLGIGFVWNSLKHLALPHNALDQLDSSLELVPWLQTLDLSHNLITSAAELCCLPNLKYANLGYNKLEMVPIFHKAALHSLQILVLQNNYIENINGLEGLECITELDLSHNCLMEHSVLWPLERMSTLLWLLLEGNPLSYHPKHRLLCIKYLHPSLSNYKFVLDRCPLSRLERQLLAENRVSSIRSNQSASKEYPACLTSSMDSNVLSTSFNASSTPGSRTQNSGTEQSNSVEIRSVTKGKKKWNVQEAVIADDEHEEELQNLGSVSTSSLYLETSKDHLEMKKQILALREKFGEDNWLSSQAGTFVQDIMGLQSVSQATVSSTLTSKHLNNTEFLTKVQIEYNPDIMVMEDSIIKEDTDNVVMSMDNDETNASSSANETIETPLDMEPDSYDPDEESGDLYLVQRKKSDDEMEELFLIITLDQIKERDAITQKIKCSWSANSVLSCVLGRSEPVTVDIIFDTTREGRQNRRYFVEPAEAKKIVSTIGERIQKRPILLKVFKCMKCSTHFSQDTDYVVKTASGSSKQIKCPTCESTLVIQTDDLSTLDMNNPTTDDEPERCAPKNQEQSIKTNLQHSESLSSIGGTEGGAMSVTTSLVHTNSHTQARVCCSATSLEESRESTPSANALSKKYESDIEILSNPSQSSIEVLDEASRTHLTPNRKRSSEERRMAVAPSLLMIPDTTTITTGLTESSSSGSLTDSICTAYENKVANRSNIEEKVHSVDIEKEATYTPVTNLSSMLGGLLQSIKIGSNKSLMVKSEESPQFLTSNIQYSYTDFGSVDHRIKLHIILNVFEYANEELVLLLRADILLNSSKEIFPGCLVLSTSKVYVLRIDGAEGEDPQRWLYKEMSWTMDRLSLFAPLPFKQGVLIELQQPNKLGDENSRIMFVCILQDFQRTSNFLFYITDLSLPPSCDVEFTVPQHCTTFMHSILRNSKCRQEDDTIRLLALFSSAVLKGQDSSVCLKLSSLIVTASAMMMLEDDVHWLLPGNKEVPAIKAEQAMSNLIAIEHQETSLILNFLDEVAAQEETWTLEFISVTSWKQEEEVKRE